MSKALAKNPWVYFGAVVVVWFATVVEWWLNADNAVVAGTRDWLLGLGFLLGLLGVGLERRWR